MMNFIALDFETANEKRNSPCSIGMVVVKDGQVVDKIYYLIKPREMRFMPINIGIHGIRPAMVLNEPEFDVIWDKIKHYFEDSVVIAHNAAFDISVLRSTAELYNIKLPSFSYLCTMKLAKNFYPALENAKLNTVNDFLGFSFKHHDALYDALACSNIMLKVAEELKTNDIEEVARLTSVAIGRVTPWGYTPSSSIGRPIKTTNKIYFYVEQKQEEFFSYEAFRGQVVVFTGRLNSMTRDKAIGLVRRQGGTVGSSVTKKTTILVTNMKYAEGLGRDEMSTKHRKARDYISKGQNIQLLDEEEFLNFNKKSN